MDTRELVARLENYPQLKARVEELLKIAENQDDEIELADDAEERIIQAGRALNQETLQAWANQQVAKKSQQFEQRHPGAHKDIKKNSAGTRD